VGLLYIMSKPSTHRSIRGRISEFITDKTSAEKVAADFISKRDILPTSSLHKPCKPVPREDIKKEFEEYKEYIREEYLRKEAGQDILGRIAWGQLYEDKDVKVEGELLEKDANKLRNITRKLKRNTKFKNALKSRKIIPMEPKTIDDLLALIPNTEEFNCIVDPIQQYKRDKAQKEQKTQALSKKDTGPLLTEDSYRREQQGLGGGKNKRKTNKRKTNKRKTRRY